MGQRQHCFSLIQTISKHGFVASPRYGPAPKGPYSIWCVAFCEDGLPILGGGGGLLIPLARPAEPLGYCLLKRKTTMGTDINSLPD